MEERRNEITKDRKKGVKRPRALTVFPAPPWRGISDAVTPSAVSTGHLAGSTRLSRCRPGPARCFTEPRGSQKAPTDTYALALLTALAAESVPGQEFSPNTPGPGSGFKGFWSVESPDQWPIWPQMLLLLKGPGMNE